MATDENQSIIDILFAIDAETLVKDYPPGTAESPTSVDKPLIYLLVRSGNAVFGQASKELKINARTLDVIRWRETTLSLNSAYYGLLYKFFALRGDNLLSSPVPLVAEVQSPLPDPSNPTKPKTQTLHNYFWTSTVLKPGEVTYAFNFMVLDRDDNIHGYYFWDPFIAIKS